MHEFSLAQSLMALVEEDAGKRGIRHVSRVKVVVGAWTAVLPDALSASFAILAETGGELFRGAELVIVERPATGECTQCGHTFEAGELGLAACPRCGGVARLVSGNELYVESYEGES